MCRMDLCYNSFFCDNAGFLDGLHHVVIETGRRRMLLSSSCRLWMIILIL